MHPSQVIEAYIDDTVRLLTRDQRDDVANELRSLLHEELHARAEQSGRSPDAPLCKLPVVAPQTDATKFTQGNARDVNLPRH